jgi:uncharacterized protein (DUF2252 family)
MTVTRTTRPSVEQRKARGARARDRTPRGSHSRWTPAPNRPDPVGLLERQDRTREPDLVPVRYGRMLVSPFAFYRGAATIMAADLSQTPVAGLDAQLCGDAHLLNFGAFASPERTLLFDLNDFDETLPGPFEFDVKRMAASFTIAGRGNGYSPADADAAAAASLSAYRSAMAEFAQMPTMDIWYSRMSEADLLSAVRSTVARTAKQRKGKEAREAARQLAKAGKRAEKSAGKARARDSLQALSRLGELVDGQYRIISQPPAVVPARDLAGAYGVSPGELRKVIRSQFRDYRASLPDDRRHLLEHFEIVDVARKVVGVGSVGTRAFIVLLQGRDERDPLFLQVKEAMPSVLEAHLGKSRYRHHGERVVQGQRLMQAASDIYLGWAKGAEPGRYYYWRQLRDMKGSALVELMTPAALAFYARICGWTLARAHARSGDPVALAGYLGNGDAFDRAVTDFASRYADQNERDFEKFSAAVKSGRIEARTGV